MDHNRNVYIVLFTCISTPLHLCTGWHWIFLVCIHGFYSQGDLLMRSLGHKVASTRPLHLINIHVLCCIISLVIIFLSRLHSLPLLCSFLFQGTVTFSCAEPVSVAVTFPTPRSFLQLPGPTVSALGGFSVGFQFRTWNKAGLLLTFDLAQQMGTVWLYLSEARLRLQVHKEGRVLLELSAGWSNNL